MDDYDLKLLEQLQRHGDIALTELCRRLGMSKTTCWNRLQRLQERGVIQGKYTQLNRLELSLSVVVFLSISVGRHSPEWVSQFTIIVEQYPEIVEVHRLTGEGADYQLKVICPSIEAYDLLQQRLINEINFTSMSSQISLKEMKSTHYLPINHLKS
jgi:DNA-binding Lrp family transcriptional regulator